jgi:hypothetical protein
MPSPCSVRTRRQLRSDAWPFQVFGSVLGSNWAAEKRHLTPLAANP